MAIKSIPKQAFKMCLELFSPLKANYIPMRSKIRHSKVYPCDNPGIVHLLQFEFFLTGLSK